MRPHAAVRDRQSAGWQRLLWSLPTTILALAGLLCGYLAYSSARPRVGHDERPRPTSHPSAEATVPEMTTPPAVATQAPASMEDRDPPRPTNILLLGIDERSSEKGPWRTDTMILFSFDPVSKTVAMLSIPRDLWVPLGAGSHLAEERINTAHYYGDLNRYPGGGPALAKATVEENLEVPVHYYVRINFAGFVKIIDEIGGIEIDVPREIVDPAYPTADGGTMTLHVPAGRQHMNGERALQYARTRHDSSDIDRARRQQQVIMAVRHKVLRLDIPITRIPPLLSALGSSIKTDMPIDKVLLVAQMARQIQTGGIRQGVIDESMVTPWTAPNGAKVLLPRYERIRVLVQWLFAASV